VNIKVEYRSIALDAPALGPLADASRSEGYRFIDRMIEKAQSQRFDQDGECFLGVVVNEDLVACGGVSIDPYSTERLGRLRHLYAMPEFRRQGIARGLVRRLVVHASAHFNVLRLRTSDAGADAFYDAIGFARTSDSNATHTIDLHN